MSAGVEWEEEEEEGEKRAVGPATNAQPAKACDAQETLMAGCFRFTKLAAVETLLLLNHCPSKG